MSQASTLEELRARLTEVQSRHEADRVGAARAFWEQLATAPTAADPSGTGDTGRCGTGSTSAGTGSGAQATGTNRARGRGRHSTGRSTGRSNGQGAGAAERARTGVRPGREHVPQGRGV